MTTAEEHKQLRVEWLAARAEWHACLDRREHIAKLQAEWLAARAEYHANPTLVTFFKDLEAHTRYKLGEQHVRNHR